ncbi:para-aminobenzoate synthase component I [Neokomagataea tanensis NBRC 106556]|uniref:Para-aminobenzoate synthase component I n=2 Tax=Acetobacteraceae TaxID=433 RepID=A0ABQ0QKZ4_9PROT|nr:para-aminobenzoate synthase component I [Neokomagataea tanensis NBRC 106556]
MLDSGGEDTTDRARWSWVCFSPSDTLIVTGTQVEHNGHVVSDDAWTALHKMQRPPSPAERILQAQTHIPFTGGLIGIASYEAGLRLEGLHSRHTQRAPELIAARFHNILAFDRLTQRCWWISHNRTPPPPIPAIVIPPTCPKLTFTADFTREEWIKAVETIRQHISQGDIFQANLTTRYTAPLPPSFDEIGAYAQLRQSSPAPFSAYFKSPPLSLLSASVERFLALSASGAVETRPIKGTAPATDNITHTAELLKADTKENAENLMITDLMRHDLGRICTLGSINVPQLCGVERFAHVLHLVSSVRGQLPAHLSAANLLQATLPPGSVTGAPKHKALQLIDQIERSSRGAYCGTVFRIGHDGSMDSSVIIRSAERSAGRLTIGAGGGITWPSDPAKEYDETTLKAAALLRSFSA